MYNYSALALTANAFLHLPDFNEGVIYWGIQFCSLVPQETCFMWPSSINLHKSLYDSSNVFYLEAEKPGYWLIHSAEQFCCRVNEEKNNLFQCCMFYCTNIAFFFLTCNRKGNYNHPKPFVLPFKKTPFSVLQYKVRFSKQLHVNDLWKAVCQSFIFSDLKHFPSGVLHRCFSPTSIQSGFCRLLMHETQKAAN